MGSILNEYMSSTPIGIVYNIITKKEKFVGAGEDIFGIYSLIRLIITCFAIYIVWRCNGGFWSYFWAFIVPEIYIPFRLIKDGMCGLLTRPQ
jgi:hypothetical protein